MRKKYTAPVPTIEQIRSLYEKGDIEGLQNLNEKLAKRSNTRLRELEQQGFDTTAAYKRAIDFTSKEGTTDSKRFSRSKKIDIDDLYKQVKQESNFLRWQTSTPAGELERRRRVWEGLTMQRIDEEGNIIIPVDGTNTVTLSYDEKPGIQAIGSTCPDLNPTLEHGFVSRDSEYVRHGTLSLLAAIDLLTGEAIPMVSETHKSSDFVAFLKKLDNHYSKQDRIRIILDNHSAHTSKETRNFLATMPEGRFEFIFTPKHGSWLNMIESFFSKLTKQMLRGIRVNSKEELKERIYQYFEEINQEPVIYHWTYKLDEIPDTEIKNS